MPKSPGWLSDDGNSLCLLSLQDTKEGVSEKPKCAPTAEKHGWIKKSSGGLLGLWKDRYIQLRKTQLVVYEDEVWSQLMAMNEGQEQAPGDTCMSLCFFTLPSSLFLSKGLLQISPGRLNSLKETAAAF